MEITANLKEKLLLVGHEAEMLLYFWFSEADDVATNVLISMTLWASTLLEKKRACSLKKVR